MKDLAQIAEGVTRLEEQMTFVRRDVAKMEDRASSILAIHARKINSLEKARAQAVGWGKGLGVVSVLSGAIAFFKWGN